MFGRWITTVFQVSRSLNQKTQRHTEKLPSWPWNGMVQWAELHQATHHFTVPVLQPPTIGRFLRYQRLNVISKMVPMAECHIDQIVLRPQGWGSCEKVCKSSRDKGCCWWKRPQVYHLVDMTIPYLLDKGQVDQTWLLCVSDVVANNLHLYQIVYGQFWTPGLDFWHSPKQVEL